MAEANGGDQTDQQIQINIVAQYTKDMSFESPESPGIFSLLQSGKQPDINVNVNVQAARGEGGMNEVVLHVDAKCTIDDKTAFIVELDYAGLVHVVGAPDEAMQFILLVEAPRMLFPFARNIIADATRDGGFMPLMLSPVDFLSMMRDSLSTQAADFAKNLEATTKDESE